MTINPQLQKLHALGQSIWYDNLSRDVLNSGELKSLIEAGVRGLTSNPTIFKNAIADSNLYDAELSALAKQGMNADEICEELMIEDVRRAANHYQAKALPRFIKLATIARVWRGLRCRLRG